MNIRRADHFFAPRPAEGAYENASSAAKHAQNALSMPATFITAFTLGCCSFSVHGAPAAAQAPSSVSDGSMLQVMLGLGLVLAIMAGGAWLLRRFGAMPRGGAGAIKVIGGSAVGQRERVVLIEVNDTWLVVGVAPGHVTALHSMPKGEGSPAGAPQTAVAAVNGSFPAWFKQMMEKRDGK
jgi:flagellar protein FliO/FliZ